MAYNDEEASEASTSLDDKELPDESDMDQPGEVELSDTLPCPHCGKPIYEESDRCQFCGQFISRDEMTSNKPLWLFAAAVVCLLIVLFYWRR